MVNILAHIIQVVMFASSPDAFLGIGCSAQLCHRVRWVNCVQEDRFELKKKKKKEKDSLTFKELQIMSGGHNLTGKEHTQIVLWI